jgi:hypothetical protein
MAKRRLPSLKSQIVLMVQSTVGVPHAFRLDVRAASLIVLMVSSLLLISLCGSLLFFRELEINRKLVDRVLELEISEKLANLNSLSNTLVTRMPTGTAITTGEAIHKDTPETTPATNAAEATKARVGLLNVECASESCSVSLSLVPTEPGLVRGSLLVVLETEIPRIGTAKASAIRERYFIYPGETSMDEVSQEALLKIPGKIFHFSKGLQSTVEFNIGGLLRPLAVNVYLFDTEHNLIQHERKVIENLG